MFNVFDDPAPHPHCQRHISSSSSAHQNHFLFLRTHAVRWRDTHLDELPEASVRWGNDTYKCAVNCAADSGLNHVRPLKSAPTPTCLLCCRPGLLLA